MTRRTTFLTASIAAGALALASCGSPGEDSESTATADTPSPTVTETSPEDTRPDETDAPEPSPEASEPATEENESSEPERGESSDPEEEPTSSEDANDDGDGASSEASGEDAPDFSQFSIEAQEEEFAATPEERSTLAAVRHGQHEGYERLVFEFSEAAPSLIYARFVDAASTGMPDVGDTSDPMEGLEVLELTVNGLVDEMTVHSPELHADEHWYPPQGDLLAEVSLGLLFEGTGTYFVGLNAETEFQLSLADDPHRVIVDFATA